MNVDPQRHQRFEKYISATVIDKYTIRSITVNPNRTVSFSKVSLFSG